MTDSTEAHETDKKTDMTAGAAILSFALMPVGGGLAQGLGGMLFGFGLWFILAAMTVDITNSIEKSR